MKIFCSHYISYEEFAISKKKESHIFKLRNKTCSCGVALRYFCEICKQSTSYTTFQKYHRHPDLKREVDERDKENELKTLFNAVFEIEAFPTPITKRTEIKTISSNRINDSTVDKMLIVNSLNKLMELNYKFYNSDFSLKAFLKDLTLYIWMSRYYLDYSLVWQEIVTTCAELWSGQNRVGTFIDDSIDDEDLSNYILLLEEAKTRDKSNQYTQETARELLRCLTIDFNGREIVKKLKLKLHL